MFKLTLVAVSLLSTIVSVRGHGYVQEVVSGSAKYTGYLPYQDPYYNPPPQRIIRKIPGNGPVTDLSLIDIQCNGYTEGGVVGSAPAPIFATFAAGSKVALNWTTWPDSHMGPLITYMARAPSDITKWSPGTSAVWFKVAEQGKTSDGKWAATDLLTASKSIYTFTIPPKLKAGQYIIRHEIIALHGGGLTTWFAYPSCIQVQVTGSGTALPTSFVSFPGAYTASTPGIVYDAYTNTGVSTSCIIPASWKLTVRFRPTQSQVPLCGPVATEQTCSALCMNYVNWNNGTSAFLIKDTCGQSV